MLKCVEFENVRSVIRAEIITCCLEITDNECARDALNSPPRCLTDCLSHPRWNGLVQSVHAARVSPAPGDISSRHTSMRKPSERAAVPTRIC